MHHSRNLLLASLPPDTLAAVAAALRPVQFVPAHVLVRAGEPATSVFFPESGLLSEMAAAGRDRIETAMIGRDSALGLGQALADPIALTTAVVQIAGQGYRLDAAVLRAAAERDAALRALLARHQAALLAQVEQAVLCNVAHSVEQRLARWLARAHDLTGRTTLEMTHDFLADMLGVRRASVSLTAHALQDAGLIAYRRGQIQILDVAGLAAAACECYAVVKRHHDRLVRAAGPSG